VVCQDLAASDRASIDVRLRDANDRRWLVGSAISASRHRGHNQRKNSQKQTISRAEAPIRTSENAELVLQGKRLEQEISTRRPRRSDGSARPGWRLASSV